MAIRKFTCGHSRTVQKFRDNSVHSIQGPCPACQIKNKKLVQVQNEKPRGKTLKLT